MLGAWPAAKKTAHREQFDTARKEEIHQILHKRGTLLRIKRKDMPKGETPIRIMMNFTHKLGADGTEESAKFKARWRADGSQMSSDQAGETSSASTPKMSRMKITAAQAAMNKSTLRQADLPSACLHAEINPKCKPVHFLPPPGQYELKHDEDGDESVFLLLRNWYGTIDGALLHEEHTVKWMSSMGVTQNAQDPCPFHRRTLNAVIYSDDLPCHATSRADSV